MWHRAPRTRRRRIGYRILIATGVLLVAVAAVSLAYAYVWTAHSNSVGKALVHKFLQNRALAAPIGTPYQPPGTAALASCGSQAADGAVKGVLLIPKIGVTAPVEEGTDNAQLDVAVGHDPNSVLPGLAGNSVLEAHDVSYFQNLPNLAVGDTITYEAPCTTYQFEVQGHQIVQQGAPVYNTSGPTMTLVTCWPTNALWFTPQRFLVTAQMVASSPTSKSGQLYLVPSGAPTVPVPSALAAQGVTLATYSLPMGTLTLGGQPDPTWAQTTGPLSTEDAGVEAFIAGVKALTQNQLSWWSAIAPGVTAPAPLVGAHNPAYKTSLNVTVTAQGTAPTGVTMSDTMDVTGGHSPGVYAVTVNAIVQGNTLVISTWTMAHA